VFLAPRPTPSWRTNPRQLFATAYSISTRQNSNRRPFRTDFSMLKTKIPLVPDLMKTGSGGRASSHVWLDKHESQERNEPELCHNGAATFPHQKSGLFLLVASLSLSSTSDNIPCSPSGHELKVQYELRPQN